MCKICNKKISCSANRWLWPKMAQNGPKWPKMAQNGPKWPKLGILAFFSSINGWKFMGQFSWAGIVQNSRNLPCPPVVLRLPPRGCAALRFPYLSLWKIILFGSGDENLGQFSTALPYALRHSSGGPKWKNYDVFWGYFRERVSGLT